jgi:hypothetical protein
MHSHGCASEGVADGGAAGGVRAGRAAPALERPVPVSQEEPRRPAQNRHGNESSCIERSV